jgi:hypothetical protein
MTRKDYELIADVIAKLEPNVTVVHYCGDDAGRPNVTMRDVVARDFADALTATNPRFDRERFLAACGASS